MSAKDPKTPPTPRERTQNFLLYGFAISIVLHLLAGPLIKFNRTPEQTEKVETVKIDKIPTTPPHQTPEPPKPKEIRINTLKTNAHSGGPSEESNTHTEGSTNGVPQGSPTGAPTTAPIVPTAPPAPPTPSPPPPPTCAVPNADAKTVNAVQAETPSIAQQQGISGEVTIIVSLDANSKLVSAKVDRSPSAMLNNAALNAAKSSTYKTRVVNCQPVADSYRFIVEFTSQ